MIKRLMAIVALCPLAGTAFAQTSKVAPTKPAAPAPSPQARLKAIEEKYRRQLVEVSKQYLQDCDAFKASNQDAAAQQKLKIATARFNTESARITTAQQKELSTLPTPSPTVKAPTKAPTVTAQPQKKVQPTKRSSSSGRKSRRSGRIRRRRR